jgi:mannose/cellobiose epimerase-like protein (N-acyl-D-glucosamine 2-epimerase family)
MAYGHAFVLLAAANATKAGLPGGSEELERAAALAEERFFGASDLTWDTADSDWSNVGAIHSNNPNMHFCEAFIAAFEATSNPVFLDRALRIARAIAREHALAGLPIWENYDADWRPLPEAPAGVDLLSMQSPATALPGHLAEWAKLLGILHVHSKEDWLLPASVKEYELAWETGWDNSDGGFFAAIDARNNVVRRDKHYWAPPEALGAAAVLQGITGETSYARDMAEVWGFMRDSMSDPDRGGWFKQPQGIGQRTDFRKGDEYDPDYHALGGCWEVLGAVPR